MLLDIRPNPGFSVVLYILPHSRAEKHGNAGTGTSKHWKNLINGTFKLLCISSGKIKS